MRRRVGGAEGSEREEGEEGEEAGRHAGTQKEGYRQRQTEQTAEERQIVTSMALQSAAATGSVLQGCIKAWFKKGARRIFVGVPRIGNFDSKRPASNGSWSGRAFRWTAKT